MAELEESLWSHLPSDILNTIATLLTTKADVDIIHNLCLRSVCKSWRSSISLPPNLPNPIFPIPIAPDAVLTPSRYVPFLILTTTYLLQEPPLLQSSSSSTNCKYWLIRVQNCSTQNKWLPLKPLSWLNTHTLPEGFPESINLLNIRISQISSSYVRNYLYQSEFYVQVESNDIRSFYPRKVVLSTSGPLVALTMSEYGLCSFKFGDEMWRVVDNSYYDDVIFHKGKFYATNFHGRTISVGGSDLKALEILQRMQPYNHRDNSRKLVESGGELFLIDHEKFGIVGLKIYRLIEEKGEWEGVNNLGDYVFFIGNHCSYSISARNFPGLKPNCVYFCNSLFKDENEEEEKLGDYVDDIGVYCLEDGKCGALANFPDHWSLFWPPPNWLNPNAL